MTHAELKHAAAMSDYLAPVLSRPRSDVQSPLMLAGLLCSLAITVPTAAAAEITTDAPCYRVGAPVLVSLSGMPPGETIDVRVDDDVAAEVPISTAGAGSTTVTAPRGRPPRPIKLRAQDSLLILAESSFRVSVPFVEMSPTSAKPNTRVTYALSGFAGFGAIYAHVARAGKHLRTVSVGTPSAPCAELRARIAQLPLSRPAKGLYTVQFDQQRAYRARRAGSVVRTMRVRFAPR